MENFISDQLCEFLYSALTGAGLGVFYDVLAIIRSYIKVNKFINFLFDALFGIVAVMALFAFVLICAKGVMRWYILLGNFFGIFLYKNTISPLFFCGIRIIILWVVKFLHFICAPIHKLKGKGSEKNGKACNSEEEKEQESEEHVFT